MLVHDVRGEWGSRIFVLVHDVRGEWGNRIFELVHDVRVNGEQNHNSLIFHLGTGWR